MAGSTLVLSPSLTVAPHELDGSRTLSLSRGVSNIPEDEIQILLASPSLDRPYVPLRVLTTDSIQSVKMQIARSHGFTLGSSGIRLVSGGRELSREHADLAGYGINRSGEVLHLALRLSDLVDVRVRTREGLERTFTLEKGARVWDLKQKIARDEQVPDAEDAQLVLRGRPLQEGLLVEDLALSKDMVVHLLVRKTSKVRVKQGKGQHIELTVESGITLPSAPRKSSQKRQLPSTQPDLSVSPLGSLSAFRERSSVLDLIGKAAAGLPSHPPVLSLGGMGAAYFLADVTGETVGVFKPADEEPLAVNNPRGLPVSKTGEGLKRGTRVGEGAAREVAAFLLDKDGFASVPATAMVSCSHPSFHYSHRQASALCEEGNCNHKIGSLQQFVPCVSNCEDTGPRSLPVDQVHRISVLDMRLANTDRSGENILICKEEDGGTKLVPIDHGYCLPESLEDVWFDWIYWPQAKVPYSAEVKAYVAALDLDEDLSLLAANGIHLSEKSQRVMHASTRLLKQGVAKGLTAYDIASLMCRMDLNKESALEGMLSQAEEALLPGCSLDAFVAVLGSIIDKALAEL